MTTRKPDHEDPHSPEDRPILEETCPHCGFRLVTTEEPGPARCPVCGQHIRLISTPTDA